MKRTRYVSAGWKETDKGEVRTFVNLQKNERIFQIETKVLIGADGAKSRVARDLGLDENSEWIIGYEEVYQGVPLTEEPRLHCFLDAELSPGYLAWVTNDGGESHIGVGGYPSGFDPREALELFRTKVAPTVVDLKNAKLAETRGGRIPVGGVLKKIANRHGLLIGDAAGAVSPLTAGGLDPCMRLSKLASEVVSERLEKNDPQILLKYSGKMFRAKFTTRLWLRYILKSLNNQKLLELAFKFLRGKPGRMIAGKIFFRRSSFPDVDLNKNAEILTAKRLKCQ
jgi:flavin-dependent dehydrogenase